MLSFGSCHESDRGCGSCGGTGLRAVSLLPHQNSPMSTTTTTTPTVVAQAAPAAMAG